MSQFGQRGGGGQHFSKMSEIQKCLKCLLPFRSKGYWAKRQREDPVVQKVARCISKGLKPPSTKSNGWPEVRRYLLPANKVYIKGGILMSPSVQAFSDTERIVVPKTAGMTVVSIYHQQFNCLEILKAQAFSFLMIYIMSECEKIDFMV